jgi:hypothetical protein
LDPGEYSDTLPPLHTVEVRCDLDDREPYEKMKRDFLVEFGNDQIVALNAAAVTSKLQQMASGFIYDTTFTPIDDGRYKQTKTAHWFSSHKFDRLDELLTENQHANTLIVYNFKEELAELQRRYPHAQTIDDDRATERWNAGQIELLLVHPKSAGHGLNLQYGGSKVVFVSLPWSLELYEQTLGRILRSGQTKDVWCYVLIGNKTIDERIWASLHDKRAVSDIALGELNGRS